MPQKLRTSNMCYTWKLFINISFFFFSFRTSIAADVSTDSLTLLERADSIAAESIAWATGTAGTAESWVQPGTHELRISYIKRMECYDLGTIIQCSDFRPGSTTDLYAAINLTFLPLNQIYWQNSPFLNLLVDGFLTRKCYPIPGTLLYRFLLSRT